MRFYIDPGTGSMLFTILIGVIGAGIYSLRMLWIKIRFKLSGGKVEVNDKKIPLAIFSDDKRYWVIFEPILKELDKRGMDVVYLTASEDDPALNNPYKHVKAEFIGSDNKAYARLNFLNATILFSTTPGLDVYQWKRSKNVDYYVHIPHTANEITRYRMFGIDYYDAVLLSGDHQVRDLRSLEELRGLPQRELLKVGIPYMDVMLERYRNIGPAPEHPRTVLLAPTWGKSSMFSIYGEQIIEELLKTGYHVIVRPHPQSFKSDKEILEKLMNAYPASEQLEWNRDMDNFDVLRRSDILISDFSGVVFDFALIYGKPIIYTEPNFDRSMYDAWWLDTPWWTLSALPRLGRELTRENIGSIKEVIDQCLTDEVYEEGRREVTAETWAHQGEGAVRVADYLMNKYAELTRKDEVKE